jgi:hypothetical protein
LAVVNRAGRSVFWLFLSSLATIVPSASAQRTLAVAVGAKVRVRTGTDKAWTVGRLVGTPPDTVRLQLCDTCSIAAYPLSALSAVDVSMGPRRRGDTALKGVGIGLLAGVGAGFLLAYHVERGCRDGPCGIGYVILPIVGGTAGLFLGGAAGSFVRYEDWQPAIIR